MEGLRGAGLRPGETLDDQARTMKLGWAAILVLVAALGADQYLSQGYYTHATLTVLHQIRHSFGW
jgi:hypothetical protein